MKKGNSAVLQAPVNFFSLLTYITLVTTAVFVKPMDILVRIQEKSQVGTVNQGNVVMAGKFRHGYRKIL